jgi:antitoxin (DNA-binding transcriptional repressor) of toxin-antitoxin stability system
MNVDTIYSLCYYLDMRVTGVREFRNRVPELVSGNEIVFVTKHGKLSGLLVPLGQPDQLPVELRRDLLERLGTAISRHLEERGVSERQVLRDFQSWKKDSRARRR